MSAARLRRFSFALAAWMVDGRSPIDLHRGRCDRPRCIGVFDVAFIRGPDAPSTLVFQWSLVAYVNYDGPEVPDGATIDATIASAS